MLGGGGGEATTKKPVSPGRLSFKSERKIKAFFFFKPRKTLLPAFQQEDFLGADEKMIARENSELHNVRNRWYIDMH